MGESEIKVPKTLKDMSPVRLIVSSFFAIIILGKYWFYILFISNYMFRIFSKFYMVL